MGVRYGRTAHSRSGARGSLTAFARLLRDYHDATAGFTAPSNDVDGYFHQRVVEVTSGSVQL
ncbi:hypothetical protein [Streptomyces avermitilis]|uniref:hypothetical protein n=1 Tax=Streptomyces avermitilis TaxID=33903 RepID=UPI00369C9E6B